MAVVDKYTNLDAEKGKLAQVANLTGNKVLIAISTFEVGADDSNGSVYRIFPDLNPCLIPVNIKILNDAIGSAASDIDLGLYCGNKGEVIDKDCLYDGLSVQSKSSAPIDGMKAVDFANIGKQLFELAGHTIANRKDTYDIAMTLNTAPGATGTITVIGTFVQG